MNRNYFYTPKSALITFLVCMALVTLSSSCSPISPLGLAIGAGATVANATQSEKGLKNSASDLRIKTEINHNLFQKDHNLFSSVKISVDNGRVLITGSVTTADHRIEISKLSWKVTGVREVINEVQVTNTASITNKAKDLIITKSLQAQLILDQSISSINFSIDTVNGIVYIFGIARNQTEINSIINHARNINYVENIISYMTIKNQ
jgi:osmotically-inducible protein OsmY